MPPHLALNDPVRPIRVLAPSGSVFGAALIAALQRLGWPTAGPVDEAAPTPTVVLVETDDGRPDPPHIGVVVPILTVCLGSVRSLDALVPFVRQGAIALDQDEPFRHLVQRISRLLIQPGSAPEVPARLAALNSRRAEAADLARLTPSEWRALTLLVQGQSASRIAAVLDRSEHTVRSQIRAVLTKLNADSQLVAVAIARRASPRPLTPDAVHFTHFGDVPTASSSQ